MIQIEQRKVNGPELLIALLCAMTLLLDGWIVQTYPIIYWYDPYMRLAHREQILVGRWLPALQTVIVVVGKLTTDLTAIRMALAVVAAGAVWAIYLLAARLFSPSAGLIAAALLASNIMFVALSTAPYPEVLFVGLVFLSFYFLDEPRTAARYTAGAVCVNLACLTRYEGWLLAAVLIGSSLVESVRAKDWRAMITTTALLGLAPFGWTLLGALTIEPHETEILSRLTFDHWLAFAAQYLDLLKWQAGLGVVLLGVAGLIGAGWMSSKRTTHLQIVVFLVLDLLLIGLLQPWQFGNLRQTFVAIVFLILYAAFALERLVFGWLGRGALRPVSLVVVVCLMVLFFLPRAPAFVAGAASEPDFRAPALVGRWLKTQALDEARVLVLADHAAQPYVIATYSGLPLENIIDLAKVDSPTVKQKLESARVIYVAAVYKNKAGLSPSALELLNELEAGHILAHPVLVDSARVWILESNSWP